MLHARTAFTVVLVVLSLSSLVGGVASSSLVSSGAPQFRLTFVESGLPLGTYWFLSIDGLQFYSNGTTIVLYEPVGIHATEFGAYNGATIARITGPHHPTPAWLNETGPSTFHVFFGTNETLQFNASGLPPYAPWSVTIAPVASDSGPLPQTWAPARGTAYGQLCGLSPTVRCRGTLYDPISKELFVSVGTSANGYVVIYNLTLGIPGGPLVKVDPVNGTPGAMVFDSVDRTVYVASSALLNWGQLTVISDRTNDVVGTVALGGSPSNLAYDSAQDEVFVENSSALLNPPWAISVVAAPSNTISSFLRFSPSTFLGGMTYDSALDQVFVATGNNVTRIYGSNNSIGPSISAPGASDVLDVGGALRIAEGLSCNGSNDVAFASAYTGAISATMSVAPLCPAGIAFDPYTTETIFGSSNSSSVAYVLSPYVHITNVTVPGCSNLVGRIGGLAWVEAVSSLAIASCNRLAYLTEWSNSWTSQVNFTVPAGAVYQFRITGPGPSFHGAPVRGTVRIPDHAVTIPVRFHLLAAPVVFSESGLPTNGSAWTVTIANGTSTAIGYPLQETLIAGEGPIRFHLPNGTFSWVVTSTVGAPTPASGTVTVTYPERAQNIVVAF